MRLTGWRLIMLVGLAAIATFSGCQLVQRVERDCADLPGGKQTCRCRDQQTGRFVRCPERAIPPEPECWDAMTGRPCP